MPVVARLDWLIRQVQAGRRYHLSIGEALDDSKDKAKITVEPPERGRISMPVSCALVQNFAVLRGLAASNISVDRGHLHKSSARSVVSIWVSMLPSLVVLKCLVLTTPILRYLKGN